MAAPDTASIFSGISAAPSRLNYARQPQFTLETFSNADFIVKDFVEGLSDSAIPASRRSAANTSQTTQSSTQPFDPKPLIRTFEQALNRLKGLSEDLELQENELSAGVRRAEAQHNQNIRARERELDHAVDNFHRLERSLDGGDADGGNAAVRIGERLEELDRQRQRAEDAKFILHCWIEVSERGDLGSLEDVRRLGGGEGKVRCAHIARQLLKISQRLEPNTPSSTTNGHSEPNGLKINGLENSVSSLSNGSTNQTTVLIEKFLESLEKDLLKHFDDFYRRQNFDGMRVCLLSTTHFLPCN